MKKYTNFNGFQILIFILLAIPSLMLAQQSNPTDVSIFLSSVTDTSIVEGNQTFNATSPGSEFQYRIQLENLTDNKADSIVVIQILPPDVDFVASTMTPTSVASNQLSWRLSELDGAQQQAWIVDVALDIDTPEEIEELVCFVSFSCPNDTAATNDSFTETVVIIHPSRPLVDIGVHMTVQTDTTVERSGESYPAVYDDEIYHYTIQINNIGATAAESTKVLLALPNEISTTDQEPPYEKADGDLLSWTFPALSAGGDTTITVYASGVLEDEGFLLVSVQATADNDQNAENNSDSVAVWFLDREQGPAQADLEISYEALADSTIQIDGNLYTAIRYSENFDYILQVRNNGPATAHDIQISSFLPSDLEVSLFSETPQNISDTDYVWQIDSLLAGASWSLAFLAKAREGISDFPFRVESTVTVSSPNDSSLHNNSAEAVIYILNDPVQLPDLSVRVSVDADSFETTASGELPVLFQGATVTVEILVSNWSPATAENISASFVADDSLQIIDAQPSPVLFSADSVMWQLDSMDANSSMQLTAKVSLSVSMPIARNLLQNTVSVSAENEDPASRDNNRKTLTMVNYGLVAQPFEPLIQITPDVATVSDTFWVRVQFPVDVEEWDIWVHLPNGEIQTDFADDFIERTDIESGVWYDIDEPFMHTTLLSGDNSENLVFELRATGLYGSSGTSRGVALVNLAFDLVPPNVIPPGSTEIPINFAVSGGHVEMKLYDVAGRFITDLVDDEYQAGLHTLLWNGQTENGQLVGSGVYLITLRTQEANTWKKIIIVR